MRSFLFRAVAVCLLISGPSTALNAKTWTGGAGSYWSNPGNWNPQAVPAAGEALVFPNASLAMVDDLPSGTAVGALTFQGGNVNFTGANSLTLMGDVTLDANNASSLICSVPLKIGAPLTMNAAWNNTYYAIDVNGQTLTINNVHPVFFKVLSGSGTVNANGLGIEIDNDGTFSGTLAGTWNIEASVPDANVNAATLTGNGTVGNVVVSNLRPGWNNPGGADLHNVGYLWTKSLTITHQYAVDLTSFNHDQAIVTGSVTLTGASLAVSLPNSSPPAGTPMTIISNDGSDPVVGTFAGLPEGATFTADGTPFTISYHGGDGNDVTLTPGTGVKSFVGGYFAAWANPSSWAPQAIPVAGEPLLFSIGTSYMTNDLPAGFMAGPLTFKGGAVTLSGNALTLTGDVTFQPPVSLFHSDAPLKIGNALTLGSAPDTYYAVIDVNGKTLTIATSRTVLGKLNGSGTVELTGPGVQISMDGTFAGSIHGSVQLVTGSLPNADITGALTGNGQAGNVVATTLRPGLEGSPSDPVRHFNGFLQTKSLTLAGSLDINVDMNQQPGLSDRVQVKGTVSLNGALNVSVPGAVPAFGQSFVILDNDGTDKINGTFTNLPEGAAVHAGNTLFRISYVGGDGNDVELTTAAQPVITVTQPKASTVIGEKATFTASFGAGSPSPFGSLTFAVDGVPIGTVPITNGSATIDVPSFTIIGDRMITASWAGAGAFLPAVSAPLTHTVRRGDTSTTLVALDPLVYGSSRFTVTTAVIAPAVTSLSGSVTLRDNGIVVGTANLDGNVATIAVPSLRPGTHLLIASYDGSSTLAASESRPLTVSIARAETRLTVSRQETSSNVSLTVVASSATEVPDVPTGTVTITENGDALAVVPINGTANVLLTLNPGTHHLTVTYSGDANFLADTAQYDVTFGSQPPSRHRGVRH